MLLKKNDYLYENIFLFNQKSSIADLIAAFIQSIISTGFY